jgi:CheY-like chemotaxis protein
VGGGRDAANGRDAIDRAAETAPDVILLDLELPDMTGIDVATQILARDPQSRILFLSAHRSWDIVEAALGNGARGYIVKTDAARELLPAMEAVAGGRRVISNTLTGRSADGPGVAHRGPPPRSHCAGIYSSEDLVVEKLARFAATALHEGQSVIIVSCAPRRNEIDRRLRAEGIDVDEAARRGRHAVLGIDETLSQIVVDGMPDEARFWKAVVPLIATAAHASNGRPPRIAACGECSAGLLRQGRIEAAFRLEQLWDDFARTCNVHISCGYTHADAAGADEAEVFRRLRQMHSAFEAL